MTAHCSYVPKFLAFEIFDVVGIFLCYGKIWLLALFSIIVGNALMLNLIMHLGK